MVSDDRLIRPGTDDAPICNICMNYTHGYDIAHHYDILLVAN